MHTNNDDERQTCAYCDEPLKPGEEVEACGRVYCCDECAGMELECCEHCGEWVDPEGEHAVIASDGCIFCNPSCAHAYNYHECECCGEWFDADDGDAVEHDGEHYCSSDCAHDCGLECCEWCGEWHDENDSIVPDERNCFGVYCSPECADADGYRCCDDCGEWYSYDSMYSTQGGSLVCGSCIEDYVCCEACCEYVPYDSAVRADDGYFYCEDCANDESVPVHHYGYSPEVVFFGGTCANHPSLGIELETDRDGCYHQTTREQYALDLLAGGERPEIYLKSDGSLSGDGVEVVSHPCTLEYHLGAGVWEHVAATAKRHGYTSHDNGRCGLHIHISRSYFGESSALQMLGGYKIMRILQRNETQFDRFSRRNGSTQWATYSTSRDYGERTEPTSEKARMMDRDETNKYLALNFRHSATFELRICRGTLNLETLRASLCMADGLARYAKSHTDAACETVTFAELCAWILSTQEYSDAREAFAAYLDRRGLAVPANILELYGAVA